MFVKRKTGTDKHKHGAGSLDTELPEGIYSAFERR